MPAPWFGVVLEARVDHTEGRGSKGRSALCGIGPKDGVSSTITAVVRRKTGVSRPRSGSVGGLNARRCGCPPYANALPVQR
jgi:hypothetical protein